GRRVVESAELGNLPFPQADRLATVLALRHPTVGLHPCGVALATGPAVGAFQPPVFLAPNCHTPPPPPFCAAVLADSGLYRLWFVIRSFVAIEVSRLDSISRSRSTFSRFPSSSPAIKPSTWSASARHMTTTRQYSSSNGATSGWK